MTPYTTRFLFLFVAGALPWLAKAGTCDNCDLNCSRFDFVCKGKRGACWAAGGTFRAYVATVSGGCYADPVRNDKRGLIADAKNLLVSKGIYSRSKVDSITYRFCRALGVGGADGMTPSSKTVLFDDNVRFNSKEDVAWLMAHELKHTDQYNRWGSGGFACRYSGQLVRGNGSGSGNYIEKEAYIFDDCVEGCIERGRTCRCH